VFNLVPSAGGGGIENFLVEETQGEGNGERDVPIRNFWNFHIIIIKY
jgi:hypothetical protein